MLGMLPDLLEARARVSSMILAPYSTSVCGQQEKAHTPALSHPSCMTLSSSR